MIALLICILFLSSEAANFPKNWRSCNKSDPKMNECLKTAITGALKDLLPGKKSLGVLPLDPLIYKHLHIVQGSGPVSVEIEFNDFVMTGFKKFKINKIMNDWKILEAHIEIPGKLIFEGKYKIKGKVLVLPINGEGHSKLIFDNFKAIAKFQLREKNVKGKNYYHVEHMAFDFETSRLHYHFDNLFNGDKALGNNMNVFLNENWKEVITELKPSLSKAFGTSYKEISNKIFSKLEITEISPP